MPMTRRPISGPQFGPLDASAATPRRAGGPAPGIEMAPGIAFARGIARAAVALMAALTIPAAAEVRSYEISADEMTRQAAGHFPIQRCALMLACVTLSDPRVRLINGDERIHVTTTVRPEVGGQRLDSGEVDLAGTPRYAPDRGAFFLEGAKVTESRFPGLSQQQARTVSELASGLLAESLRKEPIYQLDDADARQALARLVLREVRVRHGRLQLVVGADEP